MRLRANAIVGFVLIGLVLAVALVAAFWTPFDPVAINLRERLQPPSAGHWLGTDEFGRDVLSRAMAGARNSATLAVVTVAIAVTVGTIVGMVTGYFRGWTDRIVMTLNDALLAFPGILLALGVLVVIGAGQYAIVIALTCAYTPAVVRVVRGSVFSIRQREYVEASILMGNSSAYTIFRHVMPNSIAPVTVLATVMLGWVLLAESALSFLGLGVPPPAPSWGNMLASSRPYLRSAIWLQVTPGICIAVTVLGVTMLGDALRDRLDPRTVFG